MSTDRHRAFGSKDLARRLGKLTVGEFLHTWRISEEMSLADFGKLVGMSVANLCDIEKGRKGVSPERRADRQGDWCPRRTPYPLVHRGESTGGRAEVHG